MSGLDLIFHLVMVCRPALRRDGEIRAAWEE